MELQNRFLANSICSTPPAPIVFAQACSPRQDTELAPVKATLLHVSYPSQQMSLVQLVSDLLLFRLYRALALQDWPFWLSTEQHTDPTLFTCQLLWQEFSPLQVRKSFGSLNVNVISSFISHTLPPLAATFSQSKEPVGNLSSFTSSGTKKLAGREVASQPEHSAVNVAVL